MFDSRDIEKYKAEKAPDTLREWIFADADALADKKERSPKKAKILGGAFTRTASAFAACFLIAVAMIFALRPGNSEFYIRVNGERLDRSGEGVAVHDVAIVYARDVDTPAGIPVEIEGKESVAVTVTGGSLWSDDGKRLSLTEPTSVDPGDLLYWLPNGDAPSTLTLTDGDKTAVYTLKRGNDSANLQIIFEKQGENP